MRPNNMHLSHITCNQPLLPSFPCFPIEVRETRLSSDLQRCLLGDNNPLNDFDNLLIHSWQIDPFFPDKPSFTGISLNSLRISQRTLGHEHQRGPFRDYSGSDDANYGNFDAWVVRFGAFHTPLVTSGSFAVFVFVSEVPNGFDEIGCVFWDELLLGDFSDEFFAWV